MKSILHKPFVNQSRHKRLTLMMLMSFCLTFMGQAFATPMVCMMPAEDMKSPCHQMMNKANMDDQSESKQTVSQSMLMDCCDKMNSVNSSDSAISSDDCACPDGGCAASLSILIGFSNPSRLLSEQAHYYSITGFPSQIASALFRPPIA